MLETYYSVLRKILHLLHTNKRTYIFLKTTGLYTIFIPPAERKGMENREFLLFVGRMTTNKNPLFAIKLARTINKELVLIGREPLEDIVSKLSKKYAKLCI